MKEKIKEILIKISKNTEEIDAGIDEILKIVQSNTTMPDEIFTSTTPIQIPPKIETKICYKCNKEKPITEYNVCKGNAGGHHSYCKTCFAEYSRINREIEKLQKQLETLGE